MSPLLAFSADWAKLPLNWNNGWAPVQEDNQPLFCQLTTKDYRLVNFGNGSWSNYSVEIHVRITSDGVGHAAILTRLDSKVWGYRHSVDVQKSGAALISQYYYGGDQGKDAQTLGTYSLTLRSGQWYTLRAEVDGNQIRTFINGRLASNRTATQRTNGTAGLEAGPNSTVCIDSMIVRSLERSGEALASAAHSTLARYANIQLSPDQASPVIGSVNKGEDVFILGRTADGQWVQIRQDKLAMQGWVPAAALQ